MHLLPYYTTEDNKGYIFSALNNPCSIEDIANTFNKGTISEAYKDALMDNLYDVGAAPNEAYFKQL